MPPVRTTVTEKGRNGYLGCLPEENFTGPKLPSQQQVISVFMHHHLILKNDINKSANFTAEKIEEYWSKAFYTSVTQMRRNIVRKIKVLWKEYNSVKQSASNDSKFQKKKEENFEDKIKNYLFDVAGKDALSKIELPEDRKFLELQRERGRKGYMDRLDTDYMKKKEKSATRKNAELRRTVLHKQEKEASKKGVVLESSEGSVSAGTDTDSDFELQGRAGSSKTQKRKSTLNSNIVMALDRAGVTSRKAAHLLTAIQKPKSGETNQRDVCASTIHRQRNRIREKTSEILKSEKRKQLQDSMIVIHWDGKSMPDGAGSRGETVDMLPVVASQGQTEYVLEICELKSGTGAAQAKAVAAVVNDWNLQDKVGGACFDTTLSNTGPVKGAAKLLEKELKKAIIQFPCQHHSKEVILSAVFSKCLGRDKNPEVGIISKLIKQWPSIDKTKYMTSKSNRRLSRVLGQDIQITTKFAHDYLKKSMPREHYRELLEVSLIFLGDVPPRGVRFRAPESAETVRWMEKLLSSFKIWMFQGQLSLTSAELKGIERVCIFGVKIYLRSWFKCPIAVEAPYNDLQLLRDALRYKTTDKEVAMAAVDKISRHLWYLNEELIALSFFDSRVPAETKRRMSENTRLNKGDRDFPKKPTLSTLTLKEIQQFSQRDLDSFVSTNTLRVFKCFKLDYSFLETDPDSWSSNEAFTQAQKIVQELQIINDPAERGVALAKRMHRSLTRTATQRKAMVHTIQGHLEQHPCESKRRRKTVT